MEIKICKLNIIDIIHKNCYNNCTSYLKGEIKVLRNLFVLKREGWSDEELEALRKDLNSQYEKKMMETYLLREKISYLLEWLGVNDVKLKEYISCGLLIKMNTPEVTMGNIYAQIADRYCVEEVAVKNVIRYAIRTWHLDEEKRKFFRLKSEADRVTNTILFKRLYEEILKCNE